MAMVLTPNPNYRLIQWSMTGPTLMFDQPIGYFTPRSTLPGQQVGTGKRAHRSNWKAGVGCQ
jgi:hypothetical protein